MTVFINKSEFLRLGTQHITPSISHASQDCSVCKDPLAVHPHTATSNSTFHPALRITACGHILGAECLSAWLDIGNTCPVCARMLFEACGPRITQDDVDGIIHSLGHMYSERRILSVLAWRMTKQDLDEAMVRRTNEEIRRKQALEEAARRNEFMMTEQDWMESDEELNVGGDDDDDDEDFDVDATFGVDDDDQEEVNEADEEEESVTV